MPSSKLKVNLAKVLMKEGYIADYRVETVEGKPGTTLTITLKYSVDRKKTIIGLKRVSKPGRRVYARQDRLPRVLGGMGTAILSTSRSTPTTLQPSSSKRATAAEPMPPAAPALPAFHAPA